MIIVLLLHLLMNIHYKKIQLQLVKQPQQMLTAMDKTGSNTVTLDGARPI